MLAPRNPLSEAALTRDEIEPGVRFVHYTPGESASVKRGTFMSSPYEDEHEDMVVDYRLNGSSVTRTLDLGSFGITQSPDGHWNNCITIPETS